jgi:hypothetical protein
VDLQASGYPPPLPFSYHVFFFAGAGGTRADSCKHGDVRQEGWQQHIGAAREVVAGQWRPSSPSLLLPQLQCPQWICRPAATLLPFPSPTMSSFLQELEARGSAATTMTTCVVRRRELFFVCQESNRTRAFVLISYYNVIRDMVSEMRDRHISLLSCGASPLRFSHVVFQVTV